MLVLPEAENRTIVSSFVWTKHRNVTDRRTDRQSAGGYYSGLHCKQRGRAVKSETYSESVDKERRWPAAFAKQLAISRKH